MLYERHHSNLQASLRPCLLVVAVIMGACVFLVMLRTGYAAKEAPLIKPASEITNLAVLQEYQKHLKHLLQMVESQIDMTLKTDNVSVPISSEQNSASSLSTKDYSSISETNHQAVFKREIATSSIPFEEGSGFTEASLSNTLNDTSSENADDSEDYAEFSPILPMFDQLAGVSSPLPPNLGPTESNGTPTTVAPQIMATVDGTTEPVLVEEPVVKVQEEVFSSRPQRRNDCQRLTQDQLVKELKDKGTYNPDFMAWDVPGVIRFLETATATFSAYDKETENKSATTKDDAVEKNMAALERILTELGVNCNVRSPKVVARLHDLTTGRNRRDAEPDRLRTKRQHSGRTKRQNPVGKPWGFYERNKYLYSLYRAPSRDDAGRQRARQRSPPAKNDKQTSEPQETKAKENPTSSKKHDSDIVGQVHVVPFGCKRRGAEEDGYLRLCGACQAIRRLPDDFFPLFINEVLCDEDKACLYFYDYPHGKCKQKHMNFVVLRNMGTPDCQIWRRFNISVRVSCECFVDEMSFFAKYV